MSAVVVIENVDRWRLNVPGVPVVSAREYVLGPLKLPVRRPSVFNMCRSYAYQSLGYYVSLLAAARGHRPIPSVEALQDLRLPAVQRILSKDFDALLQRSLGALRSDEFDLSIYFGRNVAKRYDRLCQALFNQFPAPFLRATFERGSRWRLTGLRAVGTNDIPDVHQDFVLARATAYFAQPRRSPRPKPESRYDLAILWDGAEQLAPSDDAAIRKFMRAARQLGLNPTVIGKDDYGRIAEFDALFIRETTAVNHHTFRFARRAEVEGLVVIDDPVSILRCTNKIYQHEAFVRHGVPHPRTVLVRPQDADATLAALGLPCVLKQPDSAFSQGVVRVTNRAEFTAAAARILKTSDLALAQEFVPSAFDWRIGVLDHRPLYACRYHMARGHWQVARTLAGGNQRFGKVETMPIEDVPPAVVEAAVLAANTIGSGIYGVDVKEVDGRALVMEVNDNPNLEAGYEDKVLKDELYLSVMRVFRDRLDARGAALLQ